MTCVRVIQRYATETGNSLRDVVPTRDQEFRSPNPGILFPPCLLVALQIKPDSFSQLLYLCKITGYISYKPREKDTKDRMKF